jgi:hypothetical protein
LEAEPQETVLDADWDLDDPDGNPVNGPEVVRLYIDGSGGFLNVFGRVVVRHVGHDDGRRVLLA